MTQISYTVRDSAGASVTNTVAATALASAGPWVAPKYAPIVWSGSTAEFGFPTNSGGFGRWLGAPKLTSLKAQGFDGLRQTFELGVVMGQTGTTQQASIANYVAGVKSLVAAGLQVIVCGSADVGGFSGASVFDSLTGPNWTKLKTVMVAVCQQLASLPANVAFELPCNEPRPGLTPSAFAPYALDIWKAVRAVASNTILIAGDNLQSPGWLMGCPLTMFPDANTWATFHYYGEPQGQQGMLDGFHNWFHRIPIPPMGGYPGNITARHNDMLAQQAAYKATLQAAGIDPATKQSQLDYISWYNGFSQWGDQSNFGNQQPSDQGQLNNYFLSIKNWAKGIPVMATEVGCTGDNLMVNPPSLGADKQSVINGRIMLRTACLANGFPMGLQQLFGVNGTQGQGILTNDSNFTFDDALTDAIVNGRGWVAR